MNEALLPVLLAVLFPIIGVALWLGIVWLLATLSGWRQLAMHYAHPRPLPASARSIVSGRMGWINYNHVLILAHDSRYLYLDILSLFRMAHTALRIPWSAIDIGPAKGLRWRRRVPLAIGHPTLVILHLSPSLLPPERV